MAGTEPADQRPGWILGEAGRLSGEGGSERLHLSAEPRHRLGGYHAEPALGGDYGCSWGSGCRREAMRSTRTSRWSPLTWSSASPRNGATGPFGLTGSAMATIKATAPSIASTNWAATKKSLQAQVS